MLSYGMFPYGRCSTSARQAELMVQSSSEPLGQFQKTPQSQHEPENRNRDANQKRMRLNEMDLMSPAQLLFEEISALIE